jgi:uncharacterized membrane protein YhaH (DUF805 family)
MIKPKEGIENFIIKKLEKSHTIDEIRVILENAGFSKAEIEKGIHNVKRTHKTFHQDVAASNNFFPLLKKKVGDRVKIKFPDPVVRLGLFAGRLRRKDFIVAILFLFSLFFSAVIVAASFIDALFPESWELIGGMFANDPNGALFLYIPILFAPFTLFFLAMVTKRLHDLDLPGILSFLFLGVFIYPFSEYTSSGVIIFDTALFILFVFLMSKRGEPVENRYGTSPASHGSLFKKILNLK